MIVPSPDYLLIARVLGDTATPEERARLEEWISSSPEPARIWAVLTDAWQAGPTAPRAAYDARVDWPRVLARIDRERAIAAIGPAATDVHAGTRERRGWLARNALRAAAVAAVIVAPWAAWTLAHRGRPAPAMVEVAAPRGATREAVLPDGSRVRLGAESSIRYAAGFAGSDRVVELRGLGYFDVVHRADRAFVVRARDGVTVRDVGTRFVVDAYPERSQVEVAVAEGLVALRGGEAAREVRVGAGQVGHVGSDGVATVANDASSDAHFGWTRGVLVVDNRPLAEALVALGRWYDVPLKVEDPRLAARRISTSVAGASLHELLSRITLALGAHTEQRGDTTVVVP